MSGPGISILIPTHNRGAILDRTLQSLSEMRYPAGLPVELVVCANACTDNTHERVMAFAGRIPGVRCVAEPKTGLGNARNRAVWASSHEICALLDDDVWVAPGWLESLAETYRSVPADLVAGRIELWWENVTRPQWLTPGMENTLSFLELGPEIMEMRKPDVIGANFSFRRRVFDKVGPFRADVDRMGTQLLGGGETFFAQEALRAGFRIFYSPGAWLKHWVSPHRIEEPYLTGVARGTACSILMLKEKFGVLEAGRAMALGTARYVGYSALAPLAGLFGGPGGRMRAMVRRSIGQGQMTGAIARWRNGALRDRPNTARPD